MTIASELQTALLNLGDQESKGVEGDNQIENLGINSAQGEQDFVRNRVKDLDLRSSTPLSIASGISSPGGDSVSSEDNTQFGYNLLIAKYSKNITNRKPQVHFGEPDWDEIGSDLDSFSEGESEEELTETKEMNQGYESDGMVEPGSPDIRTSTLNPESLQEIKANLKSLTDNKRKSETHDGVKENNFLGKVKIPMPECYTGNPPLKAQEFLDTLLRYFKLLNITDSHALEIFPTYLKGKAQIWFRSLPVDQKNSLTGLTNAFKSKYLTKEALYRTLSLFDTKQGKMSVADYVSHLEDCLDDAEHQLPHHKRVRFMTGLRPSLKEYVILADPKTYEAAVSAAYLKEKMESEHNAEKTGTVNLIEKDSAAGGPVKSVKNETEGLNMAIYKQLRGMEDLMKSFLDHKYIYDQPALVPKQLGGNATGGGCFRCGGKDHWKNNCPYGPSNENIRGGMQGPNDSNSSAKNVVPRQNYGQGQPSGNPNVRPICTYCRKVGHRIENCFRRNKYCTNCRMAGHTNRECGRTEQQNAIEHNRQLPADNRNRSTRVEFNNNPTVMMVQEERVMVIGNKKTNIEKDFKVINTTGTQYNQDNGFGNYITREAWMREMSSDTSESDEEDVLEGIRRLTARSSSTMGEQQTQTDISFTSDKDRIVRPLICNDPNQVKVCVKIGFENIEGVVDSGSSHSCMRYKEFLKIQEQLGLELGEAGLPCRTATGSYMNIKGTVVLNLEMWGYRVQGEFRIVSGLLTAMLLGLDWLTANQTMICFATPEPKISITVPKWGDAVEINHVQREGNKTLYTEIAYNISPGAKRDMTLGGHEDWIMGRVDLILDKEFIKQFPGLTIRGSKILVKPAERLTVVFENNTNQRVFLPQGTKVAVQRVEQENHESNIKGNVSEKLKRIKAGDKESSKELRKINMVKVKSHKFPRKSKKYHKSSKNSDNSGSSKLNKSVKVTPVSSKEKTESIVSINTKNRVSSVYSDPNISWWKGQTNMHGIVRTFFEEEPKLPQIGSIKECSSEEGEDQDVSDYKVERTRSWINSVRDPFKSVTEVKRKLVLEKNKEVGCQKDVNIEDSNRRIHAQMFEMVKNENQFYIRGELDEMEIGVLIDSAAAVSLLEYERFMLHQQKTKTKIFVSPYACSGVTPASLHVVGAANVPIRLGGVIMQLPFVIVRGAQEKCILGADFMRCFKACINFIYHTLTWDRPRIQLIGADYPAWSNLCMGRLTLEDGCEKRRQQLKLNVAQSVLIPQRSCRRIQLMAPNDMLRGDYCLVFREKITEKYPLLKLITEQIFLEPGKKVTIDVYNRGTMPVFLLAGEKIIIAKINVKICMIKAKQIVQGNTFDNEIKAKKVVEKEEEVVRDSDIDIVVANNAMNQMKELGKSEEMEMLDNDLSEIENIKEEPLYYEIDARADDGLEELINEEERLAKVRIDVLEDEDPDNKIQLSPEEEAELMTILMSFPELLRYGEWNIRHTTVYTHEINIKEGAKPVNIRPYATGPKERVIIKDTIKALLKKGILSISKSNWSSPVFIVGLDSGKPRMVMDARKVNECVYREVFYPPKIKSMFLRIDGNSRVFSKCDLSKAYYAIPLTENSRKYTGISSEEGHYEYNFVVFGMTNSQQALGRLLSYVLSDIIGEHVQLYVDDIIVHTPDVASHLILIKQIFERLENAKLNINPKKCQLFRKKINFLGKVVSKDGIAIQSRLLNRALDLKTPTAKKEVRRYCGLLNFFRDYIPKYAEIMKPIEKLRGPKTPVVWGPEQQEAAAIIKEKLLSAPIIGYPQYNLRFQLYCDASEYAIAGILMQQQEERKVILSFISYYLNATQARWTVPEKELFAVYYSMKKLAGYLGTGQIIDVYTDNRTVYYFFKGNELKAPNGKIARWLAFMQEFEININLLKGKDNVIADCLSRDSKDYRELSEGKNTDDDEQKTEGNKDEDITGIITEKCQLVRGKLAMSDEIMAKLQREDKVFGPMITYLEAKELPGDKKLQKSLIVTAEQYNLDGGILYREYVPDKRRARTALIQLCLPQLLVEDILYHHHAAAWAGHVGAKKLYWVIAGHYWFPRMYTLCREYVMACTVCQRRRVDNSVKVAPLHPIVANGFMSILALDFIGPFSSPAIRAKHPWLKKYILIATDHFSRYAWVWPVANCDGATVCRKLVKDIFLVYGVPDQILTDRAKAFRSVLMEEFGRMFRVDLTLTASYNPQCNAVAERCNGTIIRMLKAVVAEHHKDWPNYVKGVMWGYNTSMHDTLLMTPYEVIFGQAPRLLNYQTFLPRAPTEVGLMAQIDQIQDGIKTAREVAEINRQRAQLAQKDHYEKGRVIAKEFYKLGDKVWLYLPERKDKDKIRKLQLGWCGPYVIREILGENTYRIEGKKGVLPNPFNGRRIKPFVDRKHPPKEQPLLEPTEIEEVIVEEDARPIDVPLMKGVMETNDEGGEPIYQAEKIIKHRVRNGKTEFLVRWAGYGPRFDTFEPQENCEVDPELLKRYYQKINFENKQAKKNKKKDKGQKEQGSRKTKAVVGNDYTGEEPSTDEEIGAKKVIETGEEVVGDSDIDTGAARDVSNTMGPEVNMQENLHEGGRITRSKAKAAGVVNQVSRGKDASMRVRSSGIKWTNFLTLGLALMVQGIQSQPTCIHILGKGGCQEQDWKRLQLKNGQYENQTLAECTCWCMKREDCAEFFYDTSIHQRCHLYKKGCTPVLVQGPGNGWVHYSIKNCNAVNKFLTYRKVWGINGICKEKGTTNRSRTLTTDSQGGKDRNGNSIIDRIYDCRVRTPKAVLPMNQNVECDYKFKDNETLKVIKGEVKKLIKRRTPIRLYRCRGETFELTCVLGAWGYWGRQKQSIAEQDILVTLEQCKKAALTHKSIYGNLVEIRKGVYKTNNKMDYRCNRASTTREIFKQFTVSSHEGTIGEGEKLIDQSVTDSAMIYDVGFVRPRESMQSIVVWDKVNLRPNTFELIGISTIHVSGDFALAIELGIGGSIKSRSPLGNVFELNNGILIIGLQATPAVQTEFIEQAKRYAEKLNPEVANLVESAHISASLEAMRLNFRLFLRLNCKVQQVINGMLAYTLKTIPSSGDTILNKEGVVVREAGEAVVLSNCKRIHNFTIIWNRKLNGICYNTFPAILRGGEIVHFNILNRIIVPNPIPIKCDNQKQMTYIRDNLGDYHLLNREGKFEKQILQFDQTELYHEIPLTGAETLNESLFIEPVRHVASLLEVLNNGADSLYDITTMKEEHGSITSGILSTGGDIITSIGGAGSEVVRAVGAGFSAIFGSLGKSSGEIIEAVGTGGGKLVDSTAQAASKIMGNIIFPVNALLQWGAIGYIYFNCIKPRNFRYTVDQGENIELGFAGIKS